MPGHYSGSRVMDSAASSQRPSIGRLGQHPSSSTIFRSLEINREVDVFGDDGSLASPTWQKQREIEWERSVLEEMSKQNITDT